MSDLSEIIDALSQQGFGMTRTEAWQKGVCIMCRQTPRLDDEEDKAEYHTSALCPDCFGSIARTAEQWEEHEGE